MASGRGTARRDEGADATGQGEEFSPEVQAEIDALILEARESLKALEEGRVVDGRTVLAEMRARLDAWRRG